MINFMKLTAVIWDMDGVLLDSGPFHFEAWREIFARYKLSASETQLRRTFGMTNQQVIQSIVQKPLSVKKVDQIGKEKEILFQRIIQQKAMFLPGVKSWLEAFRQNGIHQALASSGSTGNIEVVLNALDAVSYFDAVVSGDGLPGKPDPFVFLEAADRLSVVPLNCLVIEDAVAGVRAAKAAGMKCIAVTTTNPAEKFSGADLVLDNLAELMTEQIQELF